VNTDSEVSEHPVAAEHQAADLVPLVSDISDSEQVQKPSVQLHRLQLLLYPLVELLEHLQ
jgi:hypothetical protein